MIDNQTDSTNKTPEPLSDREREILGSLIEGLSNQDIATRMHLALRTVKWYNSQIYSKLGVRNRREAVDRAKSLGLLFQRSLSSSSNGKHNLPMQPTRFVGRQHELASIANQFADANIKLMTILAPGGMGKTRLALEAARLQIGRYADGVIFVPLAPLRFANDIITAIAENIGFIFHGENAPAQQLIDFLRERTMLLVLDNFEHLLDGTELIADLMQVAPNVRIVTTSRERLNLRGETVYALRGLEFPTWETPEDALQYDAVSLFMLSAHRVRADFELQAHDLDYLARICRLTAGMPLGIELAAGWVDVLSLEQIATEIQKGIDILETEIRDVPERHRSIRATLNRTWERLTPNEQAVFMRLSVFRDGFTVAAAQAVAGAGVRSLRQLANKALVQVSPDGRHDIHELLRQFGAEKLEAAGEQTTIQATHAVFFANFMKVRRDEIFGRQPMVALDQIEADYENVRSAWDELIHQQAFDELPKILDGLWFFLDLQSRNQEGIELFEKTATILQSLPSSGANEMALARVWSRLSSCYNYVGLSGKAQITAEAAIRVFDQQDSPQDRLMAYETLALVYKFRWDCENTRLFAKASRELAHQLGEGYWEAQSLIMSGHAARICNDDIDAIQRPLQEASAIFERMGNSWGMVLRYAAEAGGAFQSGDYEQAKKCAVECQLLAKAFRSTFFFGTSTVYLSIIVARQGYYDQAWDFLVQSVRTFWDAGFVHMMPGQLLVAAQLLLRENKAERAVSLLALIDPTASYRGLFGLFEIGTDRLEVLRQELKTRLGKDRFAAAWELGTKRELSDVVAEVLSES